MPLLFGVAGAAIGAATLFWVMGAAVAAGSWPARRVERAIAGRLTKPDAEAADRCRAAGGAGAVRPAPGGARRAWGRRCGAATSGVGAGYW